MIPNIRSDQNPLEGLQKDPISGHYRVEAGYGHQALRYGMVESWLDEDDNLWIHSAAVERELQKGNGTSDQAGDWNQYGGSENASSDAA